MMAGKPRFSLVGCGRIAKRHAEQIKQYGFLAAACDQEKKLSETIANHFSARSYHDFYDMLEKEKGKLDVVSVCTPNYLHAPQTIAALKAGYHVLCEKPMALNSSDCKAMIQAAHEAGRHLFIVKQNRFNPPVLQVKQWLDQGRLGRILSCQVNCFWNRNQKYYQGWKGTKDKDGGSLYTLFSHFIDLLFWMLGDVVKVQAAVDNLAHKKIIDIDDTGVVILKFSQGCLGTLNFTTNACTENMEGSLTLFGEKGTVKIGGQYLNELEYARFENTEVLVSGVSATGYRKYENSQSQLGLVYANVLDVLQGQAKIAANGYEGMKTIEIIEKIYRASQK